MKISSKGQVTIPLIMRKKHGLMPWHKVEFVDQPIGGHAYVAHLPWLTRDPRRVRSFFPPLRLITP